MTYGGDDIPIHVGDKYYGQDQARDIDYLLNKSGQSIADLFESIPFIARGGVVTQGAGSTLNITDCVGYHLRNITTPDDFSSIPPTVKTEEKIQRVESTAQTNLAVPGIATGGPTNYVKLRFAQTDGSSRQRAKKAGTYPYELVDSFEFVVDDVVNTDREILLNTFTESGGVFTFTGTSDPSPYSRKNGNAVFIKNQEEYRAWFGDGNETTAGVTSMGLSFSVSSGLVTVSIPDNYSVFLYPCESGGTTSSFNGNQAYVWNQQILLGNRVSFDGSNPGLCIMAKQKSGVKMYVPAPNQHISSDGITFDGRGGISGLGGSVIDAGTGGLWLGEIAHDSYVRVSSMLINSKVETQGGGVALLKKCVFQNITYCEAGNAAGVGIGFGRGGGAYNCEESELRAGRCTAVSRGGPDSTGGGFYQCDACDLVAIECDSLTGSVGLGGGAYDCDNCYSILVVECSAGSGAGVHSCDNSHITAYRCRATTNSGGGAIFCNQCTITARECEATVDGGGADSCDQCTLTVTGCSASGNGGGISNCDYAVCVGNWINNNALGAGPNIYATGSFGYMGVFATGTTARNVTAFSTTNI